MLKVKKRMMTAFLAVTLVLALFSPALAEKDDEIVYLCLGDSIAAGTSLMFDGTEYSPEKFDYACAGYEYLAVDTAYHSLIQKGLSDKLGKDVTMIQGARSAMRTTELRCLLGGGYNEYDENYTWFYSWSWEYEAFGQNQGWGYMDAPTEENFRQNFDTLLNKKFGVESYEDAIRKADVISLNFGSNDVFSASLTTGIFANLALLLGEPVGSSILNEIMEKVSFEGVNSALSLINRLYGTVININEFLGLVIKEMDSTYKTYKENYEWCVNKILDLNPDAIVVGIGVYNPLNFATISDEITVDISAPLALMTKQINDYIRSLALENKNFYYADVTDTETHDWTLTDVFGIFTGADAEGNGFRKFAMNVHPTIAGHKSMADKVLSVLPDNLRGNFIQKTVTLLKTMFVFKVTAKITGFVRNTLARILPSFSVIDRV